MPFIQLRQVDYCGECPRNKSIPNPLWARLPPTHYCLDVFNPNDKEGRKFILNPNVVPKWCPHVKSD